MLKLILGGIEGQIILAEEKMKAKTNAKMKIRGPEDGQLQANFNGKAKTLFKNSNSLSLAETNSLVLLSMVGQKYCRGKYLGPIVEQAVTNPHQLVTFLIADELHWHNLKTAENPTDEQKAALKTEARQLGAAYFEEHLQYFLKPLGLSVEEFNNNYSNLNTLEKIAVLNRLAGEKSLGFEVVTWNQWVSRPLYQAKEPGLNELCQSEPIIKASIAEEAVDFAGRHQQEGGQELWEIRSKGYLEEETPAIMWLAAALNYNFIVYPGKIRKPFEVAKAYFDKNREDPRCSFPEDRDLNLVANWLQVSFCRRKAIETPKLTTADNNLQKAISTNKTLEEIINPLVISQVEATLRKVKESKPGENPYKFFSPSSGPREQGSSSTISQALFNKVIEHISYGVTAAIIDKGGPLEIQGQLFEQFFTSFLSIIEKQQLANSIKETDSIVTNEIINHLANDALEAESIPAQASILKF